MYFRVDIKFKDIRIEWIINITLDVICKFNKKKSKSYKIDIKE
jgi:hypothetical protein